jgi:hypothetical protein
MRDSQPIRWVVSAIGLVALLAVVPAAGASILSGDIVDVGNRPLGGATVNVQSDLSGARWKTVTDEKGGYQVAGLAPGRYKIIVRLAGFRTVSRLGAVLESDEPSRIDFVLELLGLHQAITVESGQDALNPATSSSLVLSRDGPGGALPASGGDYRVLFDLMPGVVTTPARASDGGQFSSTGQRPNANMFRVDGVSVNTGIGSSILPGAFPGGSLPAVTDIGTTENLVSNETVQTVELRSSDFSSEFNDRLGAESPVYTRAGANMFHSEFFGHFRESGWNAQDWFANSLGTHTFLPS